VTTPTQQPATVTHTTTAKPVWLAALLSVIETVAFVIAVILAIWFNKPDAVVAALVGAAAHAFNHNAGGSPV